MREVVSGWWTPLPEARRGALPVASGRLDRRTALLFMPKCNADWGEDWHVLGGRRMEGKLQSSKRVVRKRRWPHRRAAPAELAADLHTLIRVRSRRLLTGPGCALVERRSGTSRRGVAASRRSPGAWGRGWARRGAGAPPGGPLLGSWPGLPIPYGIHRAGRDWGQEGKGMTEDEMAEWHHRLDGHEFG